MSPSSRGSHTSDLSSGKGWRPVRFSGTGRTLIGSLIAIVVLGVVGYTATVLYSLNRRRVESAARRAAEEHEEVRLSASVKPKAPPPVIVRKSAVELLTTTRTQVKMALEPPEDERRRERVPINYTGLKMDAPEVIEARGVLEKYLQVASWRERLPFVHQPERSEPRMLDFYEKRGQTEPESGRFQGAGVLSSVESKIINLRFACAARPDFGLRANFHRSRDGRLLLDWESWVTWSEMDWGVLKKERPVKQTLIRAVASESDYYNFEFSESWRWLAVKLRSADGMHSLTGYVRRDTHLGIAVANLIGVPIPNKLPEDTPMPALARPGAKALVTVRVVFPEDARTDHCVRITDLMADRWVLFEGEDH